MEISLNNLFVDIPINQVVLPTPLPPPPLPANLLFNHVIFYLEYLFQIM